MNQFKVEGWEIGIVLFNQALLGKWLWRYTTKREALWRRVVDNKYCGMWGGWCSNSLLGSYEVSLWENIRKGWDSLAWFTNFKVGNGSE